MEFGKEALKFENGAFSYFGVPAIMPTGTNTRSLLSQLRFIHAYIYDLFIVKTDYVGTVARELIYVV